jgi:prophage regulatory protein
MAKRLLRLPAVIAKTGNNSTDIYDGMKNGTFPQSVPLGKRTVAWIESEVEEWIAKKIAARDARSLERAREERRRKGGPGRGRKNPLTNPIASEL